MCLLFCLRVTKLYLVGPKDGQLFGCLLKHMFDLWFAGCDRYTPNTYDLGKDLDGHLLLLVQRELEENVL